MRRTLDALAKHLNLPVEPANSGSSLEKSYSLRSAPSLRRRRSTLSTAAPVRKGTVGSLATAISMENSGDLLSSEAMPSALLTSGDFDEATRSPSLPQVKPQPAIPPLPLGKLPLGQPVPPPAPQPSGSLHVRMALGTQQQAQLDAQRAALTSAPVGKRSSAGLESFGARRASEGLAGGAGSASLASEGAQLAPGAGAGAGAGTGTSSTGGDTGEVAVAEPAMKSQPSQAWGAGTESATGAAAVDGKQG